MPGRVNGGAAIRALEAIAELRRESGEHARRMDVSLKRLAKALAAVATETRRRTDDHEGRLRALEQRQAG